MRAKHRLLLLSLIFLSGVSVAQTPGESPGASLTVGELQKLVPELQKGGYVFYIRHAATDHSSNDEQPVTLDDCTTQRLLSEAGREQSIVMGKAIKKLNIPIGKVLSSPFCRCKETADLVFGRSQLDNNLYFAISLSRSEKQQKASYLLNILSGKFSEKENKVIVSHTSNLKEASGLWPTPEGAMYIFQPLSNGQFSFVGNVHPDIWKDVVNK